MIHTQIYTGASNTSSLAYVGFHHLDMNLMQLLQHTV